MNCFMTRATSTVDRFALGFRPSDEASEHVSVLARHPERFPIEHDKLTVVPGDLLVLSN